MATQQKLEKELAKELEKSLEKAKINAIVERIKEVRNSGACIGCYYAKKCTHNPNEYLFKPEGYCLEKVCNGEPCEPYKRRFGDT